MKAIGRVVRQFVMVSNFSLTGSKITMETSLWAHL